MWWYFDEDKNREEDDDYVNEVCYEMYTSSAKCNQNLEDDIKESLNEGRDEVSEAEEQITCDFIKDAILGQIDENGFVLAHDEIERNNNAQRFWNWATNAAIEDPTYETIDTVTSDAVTAAQATMLTLGAIGTAAMAGAAYMLKTQVDKMSAQGLIPNEDKQID